MKATFKVTFLLQKGKLSGKAPIVTRIIVNGEMVHFSTQQEIEPDRWDAKGNRTLGLRAEERTINRILDEIKASLHRYYYDCQASGESVSALKLKNKLCSTEEKPIKSTMELFDKFITEYAELVKAKGYGKEALLRYKICKNRVQEFRWNPSISGSSTNSTSGIAPSIKSATTPPSTSCISSRRSIRWRWTTAG